MFAVRNSFRSNRECHIYRQIPMMRGSIMNNSVSIDPSDQDLTEDKSDELTIFRDRQRLHIYYLRLSALQSLSA